jgi:hypothetical protein
LYERSKLPARLEVATASQSSVEADDKEETSNFDNTDRPPQGIAMQKTDLAEIEVLIRQKTPVTILLNPE